MNDDTISRQSGDELRELVQLHAIINKESCVSGGLSQETHQARIAKCQTNKIILNMQKYPKCFTFYKHTPNLKIWESVLTLKEFGHWNITIFLFSFS